MRGITGSAQSWSRKRAGTRGLQPFCLGPMKTQTRSGPLSMSSEMCQGDFFLVMWPWGCHLVEGLFVFSIISYFLVKHVFFKNFKSPGPIIYSHIDQSITLGTEQQREWEKCVPRKPLWNESCLCLQQNGSPSRKRSVHSAPQAAGTRGCFPEVPRSWVTAHGPSRKGTQTAHRGAYIWRRQRICRGSGHTEQWRP